MAGIYSIISMVGFIVAALLFIVAIVLFFVFRIDKIIGDLTGLNARKAMKERQKKEEENSKNNENAFSYDDYDVTTDELSTEKLKVKDVPQTGTPSLHINGNSDSTEILKSNISAGSELTTVLNGNITVGSGGTEILCNNDEYTDGVVSKHFSIVDEITLVNTDEYISVVQDN
ncbi:MAG: hypothetical protein Q4F06_06415 [Eubacteriales bacterium]|nr:hypothetical protein [Eubacteriales bacterium]